MVNFMCQIDWATGGFRYLVKQYFRYVCEDVPGWDKTFESVEWIKQIGLLNVDGPLSVSWRLEWNKKADASVSKRETCPAWLPSFLPLDLKWNMGSSWILRLLSDKCYAISSPGSPVCWLQILGLDSLYNHMNQFLIISFCVCTHTLLVLFLWKTLSNVVHNLDLQQFN